MIKRILRMTALVSVFAVAGLVLLSAEGQPEQGTGRGQGNGKGRARGQGEQGGQLYELIESFPVRDLDESETAGLLLMREEEKLARDVYSKLYEKWGTNVFNNIGASEQTHMDAMESLIERYSLKDPAQDSETGEFTDQKLQQLFDDLIAQGSKSEIDALRVGAAIEEIDILDIEEYVAQTSKSDIITVYENLLKGSRNHLRSFVSVMEKQGITYEAQYLTDKAYNEIISTAIESGK